MMSGFMGRPFKIWNADRSNKKSLTAATLADLINKGCAKLGLVTSLEKVRVVLEADGTEVDDEDYFSFLPNDSILMLLTHTETWRPSGFDNGQDETDSAAGLLAHTRQLVSCLKHDVSRIITLSDEDLEMVIQADIQDLIQELGESERYAAALQDACQRHLDDRHQTKEALDLLRLYHHARSISPYVDTCNRSKKRRNNDQSDIT